MTRFGGSSASARRRSAGHLWQSLRARPASLLGTTAAPPSWPAPASFAFRRSFASTDYRRAKLSPSNRMLGRLNGYISFASMTMFVSTSNTNGRVRGKCPSEQRKQRRCSTSRDFTLTVGETGYCLTFPVYLLGGLEYGGCPAFLSCFLCCPFLSVVVWSQCCPAEGV